MEQDIEEPVGPAKIENQKDHGRQGCRYCRKLTDNERLCKLLRLAQIGGKNNHHRSSRNRRKKGALSVVKAPACIPPHPGNGKTKPPLALVKLFKLLNQYPDLFDTVRSA